VKEAARVARFLLIQHAQGCQMVYFQTKIPILGKFLDGLAMETDGKFWPFGLFYAHSYISWSFGMLGVRLVYFFRFGMLYKEKSGNTAEFLLGYNLKTNAFISRYSITTNMTWRCLSMR
jgi:hypothetical protein